jgi:hypothetical protein
MATKTISLRMDAYEKLRRARRHPGESFSQVVLRANWPEVTVTGGELLRRCREQGPFFTEEDLDEMERFQAQDRPAEDKWARF